MPSVDGLFPDKSPRPHKFKGKTVARIVWVTYTSHASVGLSYAHTHMTVCPSQGIWISARVHPAETASSYMFFGMLHWLLTSQDAYAKLVRSRYLSPLHHPLAH